MAYDVSQFRNFVWDTLLEIDPALGSEEAIALLLGVAAQESRFGTYLRQIGGGPALGAFQVEPATFVWLRGLYSRRTASGEYRYPCGPEIDGREARELVYDLRLSVLVARLRFRVVRAPLPAADDVVGQGRYWKLYYNTILGSGTVEEYIESHRQYLSGDR